MTKKYEAIGAIIISTGIGWLLTTIYLLETRPDTQQILPGLYYEQILGLLIGFITGILIAAFMVRAKFLEKIRQETFSFVGLGIALFTFFLNVIFPRFIPATLFPQAIPTGGETPEATYLPYAAAIGIILTIIITLILLRITRNPSLRGG